MLYYLKKLQEIQMKLTEEGKSSQVRPSFDDENMLYTIDFYVKGEGTTVFYIWCERFYAKEDSVNNERKLNELMNRYVYKALMVVA